MRWILILLAIGPGDTYREFPDGRAVPVEQLAGALRAENAAGETSLALLRSKKTEGPVRVFYGASVVAPKGRIQAPRSGATLRDNPVIRFEAEGEGELWAYYERLGSAWHRIEPTWDTTWIPDQRKGSIKLQLRVRGKDGLWAATRYVEDLSLARKKVTVKIFQGGDPGAAALAGATATAWLVGDEIRPIPLASLGAPPAAGAALLVRFER